MKTHARSLDERFSFIWSPFIVSVFVQQGRTKAVTSHLFTPLFMFIHLPRLYSASHLRIVYWSQMTYLFLHLIIVHHYAFVIVSLIWLAYFLSHDYFSYINSLGFLFIFGFSLHDEGPTLETLDFTIRIGSTPTFLYFDLYPNTAYAIDYVYFTAIRVLRILRTVMEWPGTG